MAKNFRSLKVPSAIDWDDGEWDLDVHNARKFLFGKSLDEVQSYFGGYQSIARMDELLFMPRRVFQYYVAAFAIFLESEAAQGDSDSASPFLNLLLAREERDPGSVTEIYCRLAETIEFVASHQDYFDADVNIYGSFREKADAITKLCAEPRNR